MQCRVNQVSYELCELSWVEHLGHFNIGLRETRQSLSTLLHVSNLEEQGQFFTFTHLVAIYLFCQPAQKVLSLNELELYRLPVVGDKKRLHSTEGVDENTSRVHAAIATFVHGLMPQRYEGCWEPKLLCHVLHRELSSLL